MTRMRTRFRKIARGARAAVAAGPAVWAREIGQALYEARYSIIATLLTEAVLALGRSALRGMFAVARPVRKAGGKVIPFPRRMP